MRMEGRGGFEKEESSKLTWRPKGGKRKPEVSDIFVQKIILFTFGKRTEDKTRERRGGRKREEKGMRGNQSEVSESRGRRKDLCAWKGLKKETFKVRGGGWVERYGEKRRCTYNKRRGSSIF